MDIGNAVFNDGHYQSGDALALGMTQHICCACGQHILGEHSASYGIVDIVVDVCDLIGKPHHVALFCNGYLVGVAGDAVLHFICKVETHTVFLDIIHDPNTLKIVLEAAGAYLVEHRLPCMAERRMTQVVTQCNSLGKVLVKAQGTGNCTCYLSHLKRMGKACSVMIAYGIKEHLSFMFKAAESIAVKYPVPVTLKISPDRALRLGADTSACML